MDDDFLKGAADPQGTAGAPNGDGDAWPNPKPLPADLPPVKPFD